MLTASTPRIDAHPYDPRARFLHLSVLMFLLALPCAVPAMAGAPVHGRSAASPFESGLSDLAEPAVSIVPSLPDPSGPYAIGTLLMDWSDEEREEIWTEDPKDRRRLVVQFWYPATERRLRVPAPYVLRYPQLRESLDRFLARPFPTMPTHATLESPVIDSDGLLPVVLISHGMNSSRVFYTALAEEIASHGYVVATIDHPHWGPGVAFENGQTIGYAESMPGQMTIDADRMDERVQEGIATMADDQAFVARRLPEMLHEARVNVRRLARQMDLDHIAVVGHAMGGMAAVRAAYTYRFFKSAVTLDGFAWSAAGISPLGSPATPSQKPLLVLLSDGGVRGDSIAFARRHLDAFHDPRVVRLRQTRPGSVTDACFLRAEGAPPEEIVAHRRVCDAIRVFLDEHLRGRGLFDVALRRLPAADAIDLAGMLNDAARTAGRPGAGPLGARP